MREIEFRTWDPEKKKMIGSFKIGSELSMIWPPEMQYAGLKDKNGKKIFEGDIVKSGESIAVVEWDNDINQDFYWGNACGFVFNFDPDKMNINDGYEVIGNKYENKELIG